MMEPREIKTLSICLIALGAILFIAGLILFFTNGSVVGIILIIVGIVMVCFGMPALSILSKYSYSKELDEERRKRFKGQ